MEKLNLPQYAFRISGKETDKLTIFDMFRKKYVKLTPEEWVRQNMLKFLLAEKKVPEALVSIEAGIRINKQIKRYDALIYDRKAKPWMLVECKAPSITINQDTFDQVVAYNRSVRAKYVLVTNGVKHYCCRVEPTSREAVFLNDIPDFEESQN